MEAIMAIRRNERLATTDSDTGALLCVTDFAGDKQDFLQFASRLAEKHGTHIELLHVVNPEQTPSKPDAQIGAQYCLEALARTLKTLKRDARVLLLFGRPEDVIAKRAADIRATLVALAFDGSAGDKNKTLAHSLKGKCACPVVTFSLVTGSHPR
jgi:nucleotide-binding universal stress UspA family protein